MLPDGKQGEILRRLQAARAAIGEADDAIAEALDAIESDHSRLSISELLGAIHSLGLATSHVAAAAQSPLALWLEDGLHG